MNLNKWRNRSQENVDALTNTTIKRNHMFKSMKNMII